MIEVEKRSPDHSYYGSFRVKLNRQDYDKALKPEYWPRGWSVRQYFHARKKLENPPKQQSPGKPASRQNVTNGFDFNNVKKTVNNIELSNSFSALSPKPNA